MQQVKVACFGWLVPSCLQSLQSILLPRTRQRSDLASRKKDKAQNQHTSAHTKLTRHIKQFKMCTQKVHIYNLFLHKVAAKTLLKF
jgi:hypothetical protein